MTVVVPSGFRAPDPQACKARELIMFVMDLPDLPPPQYAQVMIVQAGAAKKGNAKTDRTLGVCQVIENPAHPPTPGEVSAVNSINPIGWIENYFSADERREVEGPGRVTILQNAAHGTVETDKRGNYLYFPAPDYFGKDGAVMLVEMAGMKIRIVYTFHVVKGFVDSYPELCRPSGVRKISLNPDEPNGGLISFQHLK